MQRVLQPHTCTVRIHDTFQIDKHLLRASQPIVPCMYRVAKTTSSGTKPSSPVQSQESSPCSSLFTSHSLTTNPSIDESHHTSGAAK